MNQTGKQPVFRVQFSACARSLNNKRDHKGQELTDSRQQVFKDFYNPMLPQVGHRVRMLPEDELEITECHFDTDRDLWIISAADVMISAVGEQEARQELNNWLRQLADAGWMVSRQTGTTEVIEIGKSEPEDYADTELAGP